ncbi:MAG: hypothetical protein AB8B80_11680 [Marinicellaceae bacterium]
MNNQDIKATLKLIEAIDNDWAVCDDSDEDDCMVLVNENRDEMKSFRPSKSLVKSLEDEGLIELDSGRSDRKGAERKFDQFLDETYPIPFVFMYRITVKGREFYAINKKT